ncbi:hypothetical protein [Kluyvera genomosp. 2]|uniref:D-alanyl-D-alanine carboxypeptidase family protein n=1 Tax=Kluyvera genomosp. 2 TaxID=2774054 RepID=UPI002FD81006
MSAQWNHVLASTLSARAACCYMASSVCKPLFLYNPLLPRQPASLTKLLAIITALQIQPDIRMKLMMLEGEETQGSGNNLRPGDTLTLWDALHNMLLPSSNVSATIVARAMGERLLGFEGGTGDAQQRFVRQMNRVAMSIGMFNSHFINAHGLATRGQVSCVRDIARLGIAALRYPAITDIWSKRLHTIELTGARARKKIIMTSLTGVDEMNGDIVGGKTGTLGEAINHLLLHVRAPDDSDLICVVMHSSSNEGRYADMNALLSAVNIGYRWPQRIPESVLD